jgi:hypothetical protein
MDMRASMLNDRKHFALAAIGALLLAVSLPAAAQEENPWKLGNFWTVTGIHVKDGGTLKYAQYLAAEWVRNQEYAKSQGWISDFMVLSNSYPRADEPNLYLVTIAASLPSSDETDKRSQMTREFTKSTMAQMQAQSAGRLEIREVGSQMLLRQLVLRK